MMEDSHAGRVKTIRRKENVSQTVLANYLNVTGGLVRQMGAR